LFILIESVPPNTIIRLFAASQTALWPDLAVGSVPVGNNWSHAHEVPSHARAQESFFSGIPAAPNTIIRLFAASQTALWPDLTDGGVPVGDNSLHAHEVPSHARTQVSFLMDPSEPPNTIIRLFATSQTALCPDLLDGGVPVGYR
jgi:hypothetical protein